MEEHFFLLAVSRPETATALSVVPKYLFWKQPPCTSSQFTPPRCARGPQLRIVTPYSELLLLISTIIPITSWRVDFNCVLDSELDQHSLVDLHEWHWPTGEVEYLPSRLVDTFRSEHPSLRQYTRYASDRWVTEARLDYIFASTRLVLHFPLLDALVLTDYTISDHHPVVAVFQCPSPILLSQPPLPPCIFRKLSSDEKQQFS